MASRSEDGRRVSAVYLVAQSPQADDDWAQAVRAGIGDVFDHFALNPAQGEDLHIAVTQFADTLYVNRGLAPIAAPFMLSAPIVAKSGLDPDAAFAALDRMIAEDARRLRIAGYAPARPLVVLVVRTDVFALEPRDQLGDIEGTASAEPRDLSPRLVVVRGDRADVGRAITALVIAGMQGT